MATQTPLIDQQELLDAAEATMFGMENLGFCIACGANTSAVNQMLVTMSAKNVENIKCTVRQNLY